MGRTRRSLRHWLAIISLAILVVGGLAVAAGAVGQARRDSALLQRNPAPGRFAHVEGRRVHYRLLGDARSDVTFVLEAGLGEFSGSWGSFADSLATIGRVMVYDRAGYGWSEPGAGPRVVPRLAAELGAVVSATDISPPIVLVGHSLGGAIAAHYASTRIGAVQALLLIDPSHPDQIDSLPRPTWLEVFALEYLPRTARIGLAGRILRPRNEIMRRSVAIETFGAELRGFLRWIDDWDGRIEFGDLRVIVLSRGSGPQSDAGGPRPGREAWHALHASLVAASSSPASRHVIVEGAGHYVHFADPATVTRAARSLAATVATEASRTTLRDRDH